MLYKVNEKWLPVALVPITFFPPSSELLALFPLLRNTEHIMCARQSADYYHEGTEGDNKEAVRW